MEPRSFLFNKYVLLGLIAGLSFWFIDAFLNVVGSDQSFIVNLLQPDVAHLHERILLFIEFILIAEVIYFFDEHNKKKKLFSDGSQAFLKSMFDHSNASVALASLDGTVLKFNKVAYQLHGSDPGSSVNYKLQDLFLEEDMHIVASNYQDLVSGKVDFNQFEARCKKVDGSYYWAKITGILVRDEKGQPSYVIGIEEDITPQKLLEQAYKKSELMYKTLFEYANLGICIIDTSGKVLETNNTLINMLGKTKENFIGTSLINIRHPDDYDEAMKCFKNISSGKNEGYVLENRVVKEDGSVIWVRNIATLVKSETGNPEYLVIFIEDITQKKNDQEILETTQAHLNVIFNNSAVGFMLFDSKGNMIESNKALENVMNMTKEEVLYISAKKEEYVHPLDMEMYLRNNEDIFNGRKDYCEYEFRCRIKDGSYVWIRTINSVIKDKDGNITYVIKIIENINEQKVVQQALIESEERFKAVFNNSALGIGVIGTNGTLVDCNQVFENILGYTKAELSGNPVDIIAHPDDLNMIQKSFFDIISGVTNSYQFESRAIRKDKKTIWVLNSGSIIRNDDGSIRYLITMLDDITAKKEIENALIYSKDELQGIYNGITDGLVILDSNTGNILKVNSVFCRLFNYSEKELLSLSIYDIHPKENIEEIIKLFYLHSQMDVGLITDIKCIRKDGSIFYADTNTSLTVYKGKKAMICSFRDITERKNIEMELANQKELLEKTVEKRTYELEKSLIDLKHSNLRLLEANQHRSKFLSSISHEFRTPLNAIIGFTDLLLMQVFGPLNEKQFEYTSTVKVSSLHLLDLINDLLDITKIDSGKMSLQLEKFKFDDLINQIIKIMNTQISDKSHTVKVDINLDNTDIVADKRKCKQIIFNLLSNAIKCTESEGLIEIKLFKEEGFYKFFIRDNGIGIEKDQLNQIFSEFHQADEVRDLGGTGIGLAITKRLIEMHGGEIYVESQPNMGSTFWFTLPINKSFDEDVKQDLLSDSPSIQKYKILVVEDDDINLAFLIDQLNADIYNIIVAKNPIEAVELAISNKPHLILMNMVVSEEDGFEAVKKLCENQDLAETNIISMISKTDPDSIKMYLDSGFNGYIRRPLIIEDLTNVINTFLK